MVIYYQEETAPFIISFCHFRGLLNIMQKLTKITNISGAYFTVDPKMYTHIYIYIITSYNKIIDD
jgi:hypothetical protein